MPLLKRTGYDKSVLIRPVQRPTRQSELILATVSVETGRLRAARVEALLESVHEEARQRLLAREGFEYRETVIALAARCHTPDGRR